MGRRHAAKPSRTKVVGPEFVVVGVALQDRAFGDERDLVTVGGDSRVAHIDDSGHRVEREGSAQRDGQYHYSFTCTVIYTFSGSG